MPASTIPRGEADAIVGRIEGARGWSTHASNGWSICSVGGPFRNDAPAWICVMCEPEHLAPGETIETQIERFAAWLAGLGYALTRGSMMHPACFSLAPGPVAVEGPALAEARATIARLTAELAAECALSAELRAMETEALASADRWKAASEQHERERGAMAAELARWGKGAGVTSPEALASLLRDNLRALDAARLITATLGAPTPLDRAVGEVLARAKGFADQRYPGAWLDLARETADAQDGNHRENAIECAGLCLRAVLACDAPATKEPDK